MRRLNGWQLPPHKFQVAIIILFFLLVTAFYCFFVPFLGVKHILTEYVACAIYSLVVVVVVILYVRCMSIDPADSRVMSKNNKNSDFSAHKGSLRAGSSSTKWNSSVNGKNSKQCLCNFDWFKRHVCINPFTKEDCTNCDCTEHQMDREAGLLCIVCNVEALGFTKHCRQCNKCVDTLDHHCFWINNCVGKKNYKSFIALISASIIWLCMESGFGLTVILLCFTNKKAATKRLHEKLGHDFGIIPFATIVGVCTVISLLVLLVLGELLCFHILLIKKDMTTYEYLTMRDESEPTETSEDEGEEDVFHTPSIGLVIRRPYGVEHKGRFCARLSDLDGQQDIDIQPSKNLNPESDELMEGSKKPKSQITSGSTIRNITQSSFTAADNTLSHDIATPDQHSLNEANKRGGASPMKQIRNWVPRLSSLNTSAMFKRNNSTTSKNGMPSLNNEAQNNNNNQRMPATIDEIVIDSEDIHIQPSSNLKPESDERMAGSMKPKDESKCGSTIRLSTQTPAKLDKNEVTKATSKAKESSSILPPYSPSAFVDASGSPSSFTTADSTFSPDTATPDQNLQNQANLEAGTGLIKQIRNWAPRLSSLNPIAIFVKRSQSTTSTNGVPSMNNEAENNNDINQRIPAKIDEIEIVSEV